MHVLKMYFVLIMRNNNWQLKIIGNFSSFTLIEVADHTYKCCNQKAITV